MSIKRIAHVCLNVRNLEQSTAYYKKLGFREVFRFDRKGKPFGIYLEISPENFIEIFENPAMNMTENAGIVHFCLESDSIDTLMKEFNSAGIAYTPKKLGCDNTWQIWLSDPDGNAFEIHQYTPESLPFRGGVTIEADW